MAHALGCAAANASLDLLDTGEPLRQVPRIEQRLKAGLEPCRALPGVADVRVLGAIGVVELAQAPDIKALTARFVAQGVWIKPFGRIIYLTPALVASDEDLATLTSAIVRVMSEC
jgi:adenosylmethionine-8-amino-7-oxononanoate aminotransferase